MTDFAEFPNPKCSLSFCPHNNWNGYKLCIVHMNDYWRYIKQFNNYELIHASKLYKYWIELQEKEKGL